MGSRANSLDSQEGFNNRDHPTLTSAGRATLDRIRDHPSAPIFRNQSGSRLNAGALQIVCERTFRILLAPFTSTNEPPSWIQEFVTDVCRSVPYFRNRYEPNVELSQITPTSRADLAEHVTQMVPDDLPLDALIVFETSGVTGHPITVPSHPITAALYLAHHRRAMRRVGLDFTNGPGNIAALLLGMQERCFTYASVVPMLGEAGFAKINLHPAEWRLPECRTHFIDSLAPEVLSGDPVSFTELLKLDLAHKPKALFSTSMALHKGLRSTLTNQFACPVFDFYSCNEIGPVGVFDPAVDAHVLLQPTLHVEILDPLGQPVPHGRRGEITVTGGFNDYLPLMRYRTGDYAAFEVREGLPVLVDLVGRAPIRFRTATGTWINNHEIGHAINDVSLAQFGLHQCADGSAVFRFDGTPDAGEQARQKIALLLGVDVTTTNAGPFRSGTKLTQYTSDYPGGSL